MAINENWRNDNIDGNIQMTMKIYSFSQKEIRNRKEPTKKIDNITE
jgi:hypothetical protein